ncbi:hypothetical protein OG352_06270 [Streptomyces sp. NBC_01485]|uniref:hypothetical protein n=1 Tax=Streptomyces sp. NBC_01485 TaxID=2903884 RepID=UPI002E34E279|nr:hypothetical protein [Streptomyces sp. NBC_01485]
MTDTTPPPGFPPPLPPAPPAPPKKNRTHLIIIGAAAAVIAAVVATGIVVVQAGNNDSKPAATPGPSLYGMEGTAAAVTEPELEPEPTYAALTPADFTIELRTTKRQCFGSAGCNVTVEPNLTYVGIGDIDPSVVYSITYEIRGDESGPVIATAELSNETSLNYTPSLISTVSAGTKVSVTITDVVPQGG